MRLSKRLKQQFSILNFLGRLPILAADLLYKALISLAVLASGQSFAMTSSAGCSADAVSALPDQPVAVTRVERAEDGRVRVLWPLRMSSDEGEAIATPVQLQTGAEFDVLRCLPPGRWVALGQGEVVARNGGVVEGLLSLAGQGLTVDKGVNEEWISAGNLYPMPMVGDLVVVRRKGIAQVKKINPRVTIPADELFGGGNSGLELELTRHGQESLRDLISKTFADARGRLLIEVHAQRTGSRQKLRNETAQRAESIERFVRYEFSLDKDQVVSVGMGSETYVPGFVDAQAARDFVVLRMLPSQSQVH
ncbi:hypothetical protein EBU99_04190 [bacterium]|nr:hypothetical protein [bacterium]